MFMTEQFNPSLSEGNQKMEMIVDEFRQEVRRLKVKARNILERRINNGFLTKESVSAINELLNGRLVQQHNIFVQ